MAEHEIRHSTTIAAPVEAVWAEITKVGTRQRAQLDSVLTTTFLPGDPLYYTSEDGSRVFMVGRVLEVDPPRTFRHTQVLTMRHDPVTVVEWHLEPDVGGTQVTLVNSGWPDAAAMAKVDTTWEGILANLRSVVETGDVPGRQKMTLFFMRTFMFMMPASTRTANVVVPD
ncbi:SRPBCC domain-containing protein [Sanguibacter sp. 25GB23B1]|uniref:SRPBCC domain-containing protein n=1 Tax=unclassified Sanguibacter TaxID=2645534 RepID=UPI0032AEAE89